MILPGLDQFPRRLAAAAVASVFLAACGGGGGSSSSTNTPTGGGEDVAGLRMPTKLSVVTAKTDDAEAAPQIAGLKTNFAGAARAITSETFPVDSHYATDEARYWVWDPSIESLSVVNEILCSVAQARVSDMVNQGAYVALVNADKCMEGQNGSSASEGGAQSSSSSTQTQTEYERWTVLTTRADNSSPQIVKVWIPGKVDPEDPMGGESIIAEVTITEGVSDTNPFGKFVMNFTGLLDASLFGGTAGTLVPAMHGTLNSVDNVDEKPQFQFYMEAGAAMDGAPAGLPFSMVEASNVLLDDATGNSGTAVTLMDEQFDDGSGNVEQHYREFGIAFNQDWFLRGKDENSDGAYEDQVCTARNEFNTQTWRYNLYHETAGSFNGRTVTAGQRVRLNSGFPFVYTDDASAQHYGHVGYWGIWTEEELGLAALDGKRINKETWDDTIGEAYDVNVSSGKLWKRSKQDATYDKLVGVPLNWWGDPDGWDVMTYNEGDYRAVVVADASKPSGYAVKLKGLINWDNQTVEAVGSIDPTDDTSWVDVTPAADNQSDLWMWSDTLGGSVVVRSGGVTFFKEEMLSAAEAASLDGTKLYCYENCPKGGDLTSAGGEADLFNIRWYDWGAPPDPAAYPYPYTVHVQNGQISVTDDSNGDQAVVLDAGIDWSTFDAPWYEWGLQSGEMTISNNLEPYQVYDQAVTYRWETGEQDWNRQVSVTRVSDQQVMTFDKPLQLTYAFTAGDDPNFTDPAAQPFADGTLFMLEYGGPGELWGFPWEKEDPICDETTQDCRWVAGLTLQDGVVLSDGSRNFVVRAIESEQTMAQQLDTSSCEGAGLSVATGVPVNLPTDIAGTVTTTWDQRPTVETGMRTESPAVIEGELVSEMEE